ncbi:hypothetical protein MgSA37_03804 [Mucilaginibacter gotjawali]|uniref:Lantibiotic dehydratase N-terminal domain-containing protein n=1 Tax=Mucilaginibacter gotjawali TaxID=1550579 RepID=A0A110B463_9SPHI|nr:lantibiotic dehydratase family protein [Mucilaginibacter gotjawali]BAU55613.1 hypothetical protein MgSA37_03804 [Mucilaginibacter gotjawali]
MKSYNFVLLRAPLQSLNKAFQPIEISSEFDEALFLASIDLWENIKKGDLQKKAKIEESLLKYWLRSCSRSTPFGIFAGTCVLELGGFTDLISESDNHVRNVRFDMNFISAIVTQLEKDPFLRKQLKFKVNQSLYESPNDLRYIEYTINGNERNYKLTSVEKTDYLVKLIKGAQRGVTIEELAQELLKIEDVSYEESIAFIEQLCEDQIFVSDLEISVTGTEPLAQLISKLGQFDDIDNIKMAFSDITNSIESERTGIDYYQKIIQTTKKIITQDIEFKNIFQVDLLLNLKNNTINEKVINEIINQCNELLTFASPYHNENINSFKRLFVEKFEDTEVPLNIALDADLGVGYASVIEKNTGGSKWVDGLAESVNLLSSDITISFFQRFIIDKYTDFLKRNLNEIEITEEDVLKFKPNSSKLCFSNGMYIIGEIQAKLGVFDVENFQFDLVGIGGSSACNLLSRFTHGDKTLHNYTKQIIEGEEKSYPDIIFAEVVHASQVRDTNVLLRPILRMYEIPYVGRSGAEEDFQIPINDLLVSVQNDQVILRSIKFNKRVIPRLTTAHNYYMVNSLSVYSFLGDVQNQGFSNLRPWDWGILSRYKYLPRVVYKNVILKKAQWYLDTDDLKELPTDETEYIAFFNGLRDRQQLPYRILLVEGDNKLLIDLNYLESIKFLLRSIRKFKVIIVEEFLQTEENCILHDGQQNPFVSEIIIPIKNDFQIVKSYNENTAAIKNPKKFLPGSEWVYYKIYAGVKTQEKILTQFILPFIENGEKEKLFEKFFLLGIMMDGHILG